MELFGDMTECFVGTLEENRGCIGYESMANYVLAKNLTDRKGRKLIVIAPASTFFIICAFVMPWRALIRLNFDSYIMWWNDMAIITRWRAIDFEGARKERFQWERRENIISTDPEHSEDGPKKLRIGNYKAIFHFLFIGLISGALATLIEIVTFKYVQRKSLKTKLKRYSANWGQTVSALAWHLVAAINRIAGSLKLTSSYRVKVPV